jgi:hypothetical protein
MAELEECVEEVVWGSQVFSRRWGADPRDLIGRTPEWYCPDSCACSLTVTASDRSRCKFQQGHSICGASWPDGIRAALWQRVGVVALA